MEPGDLGIGGVRSIQLQTNSLACFLIRWYLMHKAHPVVEFLLVIQTPATYVEVLTLRALNSNPSTIMAE